jgi:hypothetical protein
VKKYFSFFVFTIAIFASPLFAQRRPVLPQIDLPHPYYYRELYLPQLTSGPSSVAWAPDSKEIVYSMAGTLWRQKLDSQQALQITDGPGYDYQPDWSRQFRSSKVAGAYCALGARKPNNRCWIITPTRPPVQFI